MEKNKKETSRYSTMVEFGGKKTTRRSIPKRRQYRVLTLDFESLSATTRPRRACTVFGLCPVFAFDRHLMLSNPFVSDSKETRVSRDPIFKKNQTDIHRTSGFNIRS